MYKGGTAVPVQIVYTQLFRTPLDPWAAPAPGEIGLGTIQGQVGVVKTIAKRSVAVPTQAAGMLLLSEQAVEAVKDVGVEKGEELKSKSTRAPDISTRENKSARFHVVDVWAGSALTLVLAAAAMIVV